MENTFNSGPPGIARTYDEAYGSQRRLGKSFMGTDIDTRYNKATKETLVRWCQGAPEGKVLEVGAGSGNLSPFVESYLPGRTHVAVDISNVGLTIASEKSEKLEPAVSDMMALPFGDETVAAVIYADTLEHAPDIEIALKEAMRVLMPGGIMAVNVPTPKSITKWILNLLKERRFKTIFDAGQAALARKKMFGRAEFQPNDADLEPGEWVELFKEAGFEVEAQTAWPPEESGLNPLTAIFRLRKKTEAESPGV